jgi:uncharacterized protein (DUF302 family)
MKKTVAIAGASVLAGILIALVLMWNMAPGLMIIEDLSKYNFDESVRIFESTALNNGWKIPTVHDLQKTMTSFGKDVLKVKVFELCHPEHAYEILSRDAERVVSSLMPCRVAIYEKSDGNVYVSRMNTSLMGSMMKGVIPKVMKVASSESEAILKSILN